MINTEIIKVLKNDIKELVNNGIKQKDISFNSVYCFNVYSIDLIVFISDNDNCFNKSIREIQFKNKSGILSFIELLKKELPLYKISGEFK